MLVSAGPKTWYPPSKLFLWVFIIYNTKYFIIPVNRCTWYTIARNVFFVAPKLSLPFLSLGADTAPLVFCVHWTVTNVVFSNGRLDPWSEMGVVDQQQAGAGVKVIMMDQAAHHLDLFFEHPLDPPDVLSARKVEMDMVEAWVDKAYKAYGGGVASHDSDVGSKNEEARKSVPPWVEQVPSLTADW